MTTGTKALVVTRGFEHPLPDGTPRPHLTLDLRELLDDPARRLPADMIDLTGEHPDVEAFVYATPDATILVDATVEYVYRVSSRHPLFVVMVGCVGGKHRAPTIGNGIAVGLRALGMDVGLRHLDIDKPRILRD